MAQHFAILLEEMEKNNYVQYEISNFCKAPNFAQHNTNYWKGIPYLGLGPSAHSFDGKIRYWNISNNGQYLRAIQEHRIPNESELLETRDQYNEYIMTSIRTIWGVDKSIISNRYGDDYLNHFLLEISPFISNGWVVEEKDCFTLTNSGKLFCDYITEHLFEQ
jgi:oxygen-independent coproporphyrinogen-3 oxidase